ncbi:lipoprotein [Candidatus Omnitrophus magneticus]|uniref:Lipoprotein n=1 Tax=Candidatus Omnitrophus magneticus TaxID=1609969 RepID=A0A0F0CT04_9BACT|nr:lipoprotein [Candidatus Omnitrophus magneticus]
MIIKKKFRSMLICRILFIMVLAISFTGVFLVNEIFAATGKEIDKDVDNALELFEQIKGSDNVLKKAKGLLVFPIVLKAGIGIGGEFGEGALRIKGKTVDYYNTAAASIGFQLGGQKKTIILAFLDDEALKKFRVSSGWKIGADASVAVVALGVGGAIDTASLNEPIVAIVFGQKGLMYNLTLEGAKITKIKK